jgi:hypothetical protein
MHVDTKRLRGALTFMLALALVFGPAVARANNAWTTAAAAGTVDDEDQGIASLGTDGSLRLLASAAPPATLDARYNVVAVDGVAPGSPLTWALRVRYADAGDASQVIVRLRKMSVATGAIATLLTFDSNGLPASLSPQLKLSPTSTFTFDFDANVYFVEAQLKRTGAAGSPVLYAVQIITSID